MKNIFIILIVVIASCNGNKNMEKTIKTTKSVKPKTKVAINMKANKINTITAGNEITFEYKVKKLPNADSITLLVGSKAIKTYYKNDVLTVNTKEFNTGNQQLLFYFYWGDTLNASQSFNYKILSDIAPEEYGYKIRKKWNHNVKAYTQGLEFSDGYLYEGTGNYGKSMLTKLDLDKNEIVQSINLNKEVFGEGITIIDDKIYQLTWRSNIGYVYNKETLAILYDFNYPTEGWGLTNNGKELIMSDGSENIYFLDTEFIQEIKKLQVYDQKGSVTNLNELEYIDGLIYANIYGSDHIVAIDANSGKVIKRINLSGILDKSKVKTPIDVLNGIAWDGENKRLIVTGKWWPYFYEIELIKK